MNLAETEVRSTLLTPAAVEQQTPPPASNRFVTENREPKVCRNSWDSGTANPESEKYSVVKDPADEWPLQDRPHKSTSTFGRRPEAKKQTAKPAMNKESRRLLPATRIPRLHKATASATLSI
jgi:hypothetical protein